MRPAPRCFYATRPADRPGCQLTATISLANILLCPSCDRRSSTLGKGQPPSQLTPTSRSTRSTSSRTPSWSSGPPRQPSTRPSPAPANTVKPGTPSRNVDTTRQAAHQRFGRLDIYRSISGERLAAERRCPHCHLFTRRVGDGGACTGCGEILTVTELLDLD